MNLFTNAAWWDMLCNKFDVLKFKTFNPLTIISFSPISYMTSTPFRKISKILGHIKYELSMLFVIILDFSGAKIVFHSHVSHYLPVYPIWIWKWLNFQTLNLAEVLPKWLSSIWEKTEDWRYLPGILRGKSHCNCCIHANGAILNKIIEIRNNL